jgi:quercetin dioxygenase-like cupin family protein
MKMLMLRKLLCAVLVANLIIIKSGCSQPTPVPNGSIIHEIKKVVKKNEHWKKSLITGKDAQVVMMTVNKKTNPKNEIGMETHEFDQVILVIQGKARAIINGQASKVKKGDLIFVPKGSAHNFINLNPIKSLKILSIYSKTDMPANGDYKTQAEMLKQDKP